MRIEVNINKVHLFIFIVVAVIVGYAIAQPGAPVWHPAAEVFISGLNVNLENWAGTTNTAVATFWGYGSRIGALEGRPISNVYKRAGTDYCGNTAFECGLGLYREISPYFPTYSSGSWRVPCGTSTCACTWVLCEQ